MAQHCKRNQFVLRHDSVSTLHFRYRSASETLLCCKPCKVGILIVQYPCLRTELLTVALITHVPESQLAVATGFGQLWRGIGQVGGVAVASAVFQSALDYELRIRMPAGSQDVSSFSHHPL
jgi:hypothetical protein